MQYIAVSARPASFDQNQKTKFFAHTYKASKI